MSTQILNMLGLLTSQAECPHVFVDAQTLLSCDLLERHKFLVLEIHEVYETLLLRKEQTRQVLDRLAAFFLFLVYDSGSCVVIEQLIVRYSALIYTKYKLRDMLSLHLK